MENVKRLERAVNPTELRLKRAMPYHTSGQAMKLLVAAQGVLDETRTKRPIVIPKMVSRLARVLYWVARMARRYGYSLDEIAAIALEESNA